MTYIVTPLTDLKCELHNLRSNQFVKKTYYSHCQLEILLFCIWHSLGLSSQMCKPPKKPKPSNGWKERYLLGQNTTCEFSVEYEQDVKRNLNGFVCTTGLNYLHQTTSVGMWELRVDLGLWNGNTAHATYSDFKVGPESDGYRLHLGHFTGGNAGT